ncbi:hypothetical protein B0H14DRAFT_3476903 [Mycena olivaceomarginata]|nr:hypothetical protein B0H14DRAFT_3476903 [Mycena olivaceomarginata]
MVTLGVVQAALTNVTIDDTNSNFWTFAGSWHAVTPTTPCDGCFAQPDPGLTHNSHGTTANFVSGSFTFQGAAAYIYGIDVADPANISFAMNNPTKESFHYYSGGGYVYNSLFFSATSLDPKAQHTVTWILETSSNGGGPGLFDYAVVTVDQATDSSSSSASSTNSVGSSLGPSSSTIKFRVSHECWIIRWPSHHYRTTQSKTGPIVGAVVGVSATTSDNVVSEPYYHPPPANNTGGTGPTPGLSGTMLVKPYRVPPAASSGGATGYPSENAFTMATVSPLARLGSPQELNIAPSTLFKLMFSSVVIALADFSLSAAASQIQSSNLAPSSHLLDDLSFSPPGTDATKLKSVVVEDYAHYSDEVKKEFAGADATVALTPSKAKKLPFDEVGARVPDVDARGPERVARCRPERDQSKKPSWMPEYFLMRGETENRVLAFAAEHSDEMFVACVAKPGLITSSIGSSILAVGLKLVMGVPSVSVEEISATMLRQVVEGFEKEPLECKDLVRIGRKALDARKV